MKHFIIIGNSAAGIAAVEAIRKIDKKSKISVISDEDYPSYCRCLISYYLAGDIKEDNVRYRPDSFYKDNDVRLVLNKKVIRVDPKKNTVSFMDKKEEGYDHLLIATGSSPKFPDIKGIKKTGVLGFRTMVDAKAIEALVPKAKTACILGGGLIGLKAAYALKKKGLGVKVIIKSNQVLSQVLDFDAAGFVRKRLEEHGIEILPGKDAAEIMGEGDVKAVRLDDGKIIDASLVLVCKGVSPNIDLVNGSGIKTGIGVVADENLTTNAANICAAGDVCETSDPILGRTAVNALWPVAVEQGRIAGANMAGGKVAYDGSVGMNSLEFFGLPTVSLGLHKVGDSKDCEEFKVSNPASSIYKKLILRANRLVGAVLVGDIRSSGLYLRLIRDKVDVSSFRDKLLEEDLHYPDIMNFIKDKKDKENMYV
ncbi:MAG: FAD-dependent oxidoreductase [Candidatus Omnitrophota bacterium]|nr:FAD-dependent oxidoreductase [Candidatus Omnitrophota bacterium]